MNQIIMTGRLTADPEVRYTSDNKPVASFNFAVDRRFDKENTDFFRCTAFGRTAETIEKLVRKGTKLLLEGEIRNNNYTDKNGVKRYEMQVIVESFEFCESKSSAATSETHEGSKGSEWFNIPDNIDEEFPFN